MKNRFSGRVLLIGIAFALAIASISSAAEKHMNQMPTTVPAGVETPKGDQTPDTFGLTATSSASVWSYQFQGSTPFNDQISDDGDGYRTMTAGSRIFIAPLDLPAGIQIEAIRLDNCDNTASGNLSLTMYDSFGDHTFNTIATVTSTDATACGENTFVLATPYAYDGNAGHFLSLYVFQSIVDPTLKFRGAHVVYRLRVSPAPGTATFTDVPLSDFAFQFIEAFSAAGITVGCNASPPQFCPDRNVTRREMAVFFAKALGLHFPN